MGPNNKQRSRKQYIKYRLRVLRELEIPPPPEHVLVKMMDDKKMSEVQVDAIFLKYIQDAD